MKFFHYSKVKFDQIKSLNAQGHPAHSKEDEEKRKKDRGSPGLYSDSISLFIERIPHEYLGAIFPKNHKAWSTGTELFEYEIDSDDLPENLTYEIVESPEVTDWFYLTPKDLVDKEWTNGKVGIEKELDYRGNSKSRLTAVCKRFIGKTKKFWFMLPNRPNFSKISNLYAATIPHVMCFPNSGIIPISKVRKIKIGDKKPRLTFKDFLGNQLSKD